MKTKIMATRKCMDELRKLYFSRKITEKQFIENRDLVMGVYNNN
jgi:hypothetical protein